MIYHPLAIGIGCVVVLLIYISYYCWRIKSYEHWEPTQEDIDREVRLIQLEKEHFGHIIMFHDRQSKEYKKWLKGLK